MGGAGGVHAFPLLFFFQNWAPGGFCRFILHLNQPSWLLLVVIRQQCEHKNYTTIIIVHNAVKNLNHHHWQTHTLQSHQQWWLISMMYFLIIFKNKYVKNHQWGVSCCSTLHIHLCLLMVAQGEPTNQTKRHDEQQSPFSIVISWGGAPNTVMP